MTDHHRWASPEILDCFDPTVTMGRELGYWTNVMLIQKSHGLPITDDQLDGYLNASLEFHENTANWAEQVAAEEQKTHHDLKARLNVFDSVAGGHGKAHLGMTSSDVVDAMWQLNTRDALRLINQRAANVQTQLVTFADRHKLGILAGRTHGQPAQVTTLGKRVADIIHPLAMATVRTRRMQRTTALRGVRGAVGTSADMRSLYQQHGLDPNLAELVTPNLGKAYGMPTQQGLGSQGYPRPWDHTLISALLDIAHVCANFAQMVRLMTLQGLLYEGQATHQVGSSAMPHKRNPRLSERIQSLTTVLRGYQLMAAETATSQWFEGDVANSAARRIYLPGAFYALDGILAATWHVVKGLTLDIQELNRDLVINADELATGKLLAAAVAAGTPREKAHEIIRNASVNAHATDERLSRRLAVTDEYPLGSEVFGIVRENLLDIESTFDSVELVKALNAEAEDCADLDWEPAVI